jgi:hypothetical protein
MPEQINQLMLLYEQEGWRFCELIGGKVLVDNASGDGTNQSPVANDITLIATGYKVKGLQQVDLERRITWPHMPNTSSGRESSAQIPA